MADKNKNSKSTEGVNALESPASPERRDFLQVVTTAVGGVGAPALCGLIDTMNPAADT